MRKAHTFFFLIQNKLHWHIYRLLRSRTVSEKLPKIPLFGPSLIHRLRLNIYMIYLLNAIGLSPNVSWFENGLLQWILLKCVW